jgi:hypothetical protein
MKKIIKKIIKRWVGFNIPSNIETLLGVRRAACSDPCKELMFSAPQMATTVSPALREFL